MSELGARVDRFLEDRASGHGPHDYPPAVDALVAAGLLSTERAQACKAEHARLSASRVDYQAQYDQELEAKAIELLGILFAQVRPLASEEWNPAVYQRYQEALSTLTVMGALSLERARPWYQRGHETLTPPGGRPEPEPEPEAPFVAGELIGVITGPPERLDGMRITCLELYDDCAAARFHWLLPEEPDDPVERRELLTALLHLDDDAGTVYRPAAIPPPRGCKQHDSERWPEVLVGWQAFIPGSPRDARVFTISWRDQEFMLAT